MCSWLHEYINNPEFRIFVSDIIRNLLDKNS